VSSPDLSPLISFLLSFFSYKSLVAWEDVQNMLAEEVMTEAALKSAWKEAAKGTLKITKMVCFL
jgi:hypothetical protein